MERFKKLIMYTLSAFILFIAINLNANEGYPAKGVVAVSLEDVTKLAIQNNFDIQMLQYDRLIAQTDEGVANSIFDTILSAHINYQDDQSEQTSTIAGTQTRTNEYNIGVSKKTSTGTTLGLDLTNNRSANNSMFSTSPVTHDSNLKGSISQDLGKNFFGLIDRSSVAITQKDIEQAEFTSLNSVENQIVSVKIAYWDLVLAYENANIQRQMVSQAKKLYDLHQEKLIDGLVEIAEAIQSEANYQKRLNQLALTENRIKTKENVLKLLLNIRVDEGVVLDPKERLELKLMDVKESQSLILAINNRYDYKKALSEAQENDLDIRMKKNSKWPEINLSASFAHNGLGDDLNESIENTLDESNTDLVVGLSITYPFENRKAKSQLKAAQYKKAKALINIKKVEQTIAVEIKDLVRNLKVYYKIAKSDTSIATLHLEKLKAEQKRFNYGRSDTDTLIRFQEDVIEAQEGAAVSKHRYLVSLVNLELKQGTILQTYLDKL